MASILHVKVGGGNWSVGGVLVQLYEICGNSMWYRVVEGEKEGRYEKENDDGVARLGEEGRRRNWINRGKEYKLQAG